MEKLFVIDGDGDVTTLFSDDLPDLGEVQVGRASHVEPGLVSGSKGWDVVLSAHPLNGEYAGKVIASGVPLNQRQHALDLEVQFIQQNILGGSVNRTIVKVQLRILATIRSSRESSRSSIRRESCPWKSYAASTTSKGMRWSAWKSSRSRPGSPFNWMGICLIEGTRKGIEMAKPLGLGTKYIEITIDAEGEVEIEAHGYTGQTCRAATADIETKLGGVKRRKQKREALIQQKLGK